MILNGSLNNIYSLTKTDKEQMFTLLKDGFERVCESEFESDLSEKDKVILLKDKDNIIQGFSTIKFSIIYIDNIRYDIIYSGDTIISSDHWGTSELPKIWLNMIFDLLKKFPHRQYFWILISKGYKTYRFLPVYFNSFFPHPDKEFALKEAQITDKYLSAKFNNLYDNKNRIVKSLGKGAKLKPGFADPVKEKLNDRFIKFFLEKNPQYDDGDNLACITELKHDNFRKSVYRVIDKNKIE